MSEFTQTSSAANRTFECKECSEILPTRNALYKHLETHGIERDSVHASKPNKVILLIGWLSNKRHEDKWSIDGHFTHSWTEVDDIETALFAAIDAVDGNDGMDARDTVKGLSRASGCAQRSCHFLQMEPSVHSVADVVCFQLKKRSRPKDRLWLEAVNERLPRHIRIVEVYNPPSIVCDFHAEMMCSQRRFEYVLPLTAFFQNNDEDVDVDVSDFSHAHKKQKYRGTAMDGYFPRDTKEGVQRIENFRKLKVLLKKFNGRHAMHNFVTGGACPDEGHIKKKLDRFYHRELLAVNGANMDVRNEAWDFVDEIKKGQDITVHLDDAHNAELEGDKSNIAEWAVFSLSGDSLLKGQVRKMIGLAIGVFRGWLSEEFFDIAMNTDRIVNVPSAPACGVYLAECKYDKWEAKFGFRIDPRRIEGADVTPLTEWLRIVQKKVVQQMSSENEAVWLDKLRVECLQSMAAFEAEQALLHRSKEELQSVLASGCRSGIPAHLSDEVREAYAKALFYLREAEASGQWPASSLVYTRPYQQFSCNMALIKYPCSVHVVVVSMFCQQPYSQCLYYPCVCFLSYVLILSD
jgi:tRNA U38,U39,U40 pseudouridine synthase TruA